MTARLNLAPELPFKTTLDGRLSSTDIVVTLVTSSGVQAPGVILVNRQDGRGTNTFEKMEYIHYTGISGNVLTGLTRAQGGTVARDHNSGSVVEIFPDVTYWSDTLDFINVDHTSDGRVKVSSHVRQFSFTGVSGLSGLRGDIVIVPGANATIYSVGGPSLYEAIVLDLLPSGGGIPPFVIVGGVVSMVNATPPSIAEHNISVKSISGTLLAPASGATVVIDINKNFSSLFTNQATRLMIPAGGTYASTASIGTTTLSSGNILTMDIDNVGDAFDLTVLLET